MTASDEKIKMKGKKRKNKETLSPVRSKELARIVKIRVLVVSGQDEMKVSRSVDAHLEDITESGVFFQTSSMIIDELHLSYDESPLLRNKLIIEMELPNQIKKIRTLAEVGWYERSLVSEKEVFHVGANFREISDEDRAILKTFLLEHKKLKESISLD